MDIMLWIACPERGEHGRLNVGPDPDVCRGGGLQVGASPPVSLGAPKLLYLTEQQPPLDEH